MLALKYQLVHFYFRMKSPEGRENLKLRLRFVNFMGFLILFLSVKEQFLTDRERKRI
jgi:hypothetical protein